MNMKKVVFCIPTVTRPYQVLLDSIEKAVPLLDAAGYEHYMVSEVGCPYISSARATMLRKALDFKADQIVFLDHDLSFPPEDLVKLLDTEGDVISGTYRFKRDEEEYMGALLPDAEGNPQVREDGCVKAHSIPAGFLKITRNAVNCFIRHFPELCYGEQCNPHIDLFNHGAHGHVWYGEDYAFSRRWIELGGEIWVIPTLHLTHHSPDKAYPGDFHYWLLRQPGGSEAC